MKPKHSNTDPGWINRELAALKKQIREMAAAKTLQASTIGKGGLTLKDGGALHAPFPPGQGVGDAVFIGPELEDGLIAYRVQVSGADGSPLLKSVSIPPQSGAPSGVTMGVVAGDIVELSAKTGINCHIGPTSEGLAVALGQTDLRSDGYVQLYGASDGVRIVHATTSASANAFLDPSDNRIWRSTSSRRYKQDIVDATTDPAAVLNMQPRTWRDKAEVEKNPDTQRRYVGFIAEELDDLGLGQFVVYDEEDKPQAIAYDRLTAAVIPVLKDLAARVTALEEQAATKA